MERSVADVLLAAEFSLLCACRFFPICLTGFIPIVRLIRIKTIPEFAPFDKTSRLDLLGIINLALASAASIFGMTQAASHRSFTNGGTILWVGIGLSAAAIYLVYDRIRKHQTVLPMRLFAHKRSASSSIGLFLANAAIIGPMMILPLFLQTFWHFTAIEAAFALIPQGVGMLVTRPLIGKMIDGIGAKYVVIASLTLSLIGSIPLIFITNQTSMVWIALMLFVRGASVGGINLPLMSDAYTGLGDKELPEADAGMNIIENLGSSVGSALIATVVARVAQSVQPTIANNLNGYHAGFFVSVLGLVLIVIPSFFLTNRKSRS